MIYWEGGRERERERGGRAREEGRKGGRKGGRERVLLIICNPGKVVS